MINSFPPQRIKYSAKDKTWRENSLDYMCAQADIQYTQNYQRMYDNYAFHNNKIDQTDLQKYCDPMNLDVGTGRDFIQCFNKTPNKIQILKGEELKRPWAYHIIDFSENATNEITREKNRSLREWFDFHIGAEIQTQKAKMELQAQSQLKGVPKQQAQRQYEQIMQQISARENEILNPQQIEQKFKNYRTVKEKLMAKLMRIRSHELKIKHLKNEAFFDATIAGVEAAMVSIVNGEAVVEVLNPLGLAYHKSPETEFIQDGDYVVYKREMSLGQIYDLYAMDMEDEDIDKLEQNLMNVYGIDTPMFSKDGRSASHWEHLNYNARMGGTATIPHEGGYGQDNTSESYSVVYTAFWKSYTELGFLSYQDENGKPQLTIVSEEYPVPKEAKAEKIKQDYGKSKTKWTWTDEFGQYYEIMYEFIPQVWEGTKIGTDIFLNIRPYPYAKVSLYNPFKCKLPIFGVPYNTRNASIIAPMDRMVPWQKLYLLLMAKFLKLIAQDKGMVTLLNVLMLDKDIDLDKTLQYAQDVGYLPFNPLGNAETGIPSLVTNIKAAEVLNLSNIQNIKHYADLLRFVEDQIGDAAGISKPREGQTSSNTNVTDNRQDLIQSAVITEPLFSIHDLLWQDILNELVYLTQVQISESGGMYKRGVLSDEEVAVIEIDGRDFDPCEMGAYVANNGNANMILDQVKANVQALIQNDKVNLSTFISMLSVEDIAELKSEVKDLEDSIAAREQQMQQMQLDSQEKQVKMKIEREEDYQAHEVELQSMKDTAAYDREELKVFGMMALGSKDADVDDNGTPDVLEIDKLRHTIEVNRKKLELDERKVKLSEDKLKQDKTIKEEELKIKRKQANKPTKK